MKDEYCGASGTEESPPLAVPRARRIDLLAGQLLRAKGLVISLRPLQNPASPVCVRVIVRPSGGLGRARRIGNINFLVRQTKVKLSSSW